MCTRYVGAPQGPFTGSCPPPTGLATIYNTSTFSTSATARRIDNWMEVTSSVCGYAGLRLRVLYKTTPGGQAGTIAGQSTSGANCTTLWYTLLDSPGYYYSHCRLVSTIGTQSRLGHCFTGWIQ